MSQDQEWLVRLQFLEEAQEYINSIESNLLGLSTQGVSPEGYNDILRAAHSLKGGSALMGFEELSQVAHRLEDFFKVLKAGHRSETVDASLEQIFFKALDCMGQMTALYRQQQPITPNWLATYSQPLLDSLYDRLGDPLPEDDIAELSAEAGEDMVSLMFSSEVEPCLDRIEGILANPKMPLLKEEFVLACQEIAGLGEMLDLPVFSGLCRQVATALEASEGEDLVAIAQAGLDGLQRAQALVVMGQSQSLPEQLDLPTMLSEQVAAEAELVIADPIAAPIAAAPVISEPIAAEPVGPEEPTSEPAAPANIPDHQPPEIPELSSGFADSLANLDLGNLDLSNLGSTPDLSPSAAELPAPQEPESQAGSPEPNAQLSAPLTEVSSFETSPPDVSQLDVNHWINSDQYDNIARESAIKVEDSTVRVSVNQLERLGELFGELNTRRGGLDLRLSSLKGLMTLLNTRVKSLNTANEKLRESYDSSATLTPRLGPVPESQHNGQHSVQEKISPNHPQAILPSGSGSAVSQQFDQLEMDQYSDIHLITQEIIERVVQIQEVSSDIELALGDTEGLSRELSRTARQMQIGMTQVRMRPLSELTRQFPRLLRQLSLKHGKSVQLKEQGTSTLIERSILEALQDPLMHLLRNCFDHGLESPEVREAQGKPREGTIEISASYRGNQTIIIIRDDGQGINLEKIKAKVVSSMGLSRQEVDACSEQEILDMIFEPGFSTADQVTELSGRGVGMDVVRSNLNEIHGTIQVETEAGQGTTFTVTVPLSISVTRVLVVECQGLVLAFPTSLVEEMLLLENQQLMTAAHQELLEWQGYTVPLLRLNQWLTFNRPPTPQETESRPIIDQASALLITHEQSPYAIHCDRYWGEQEVTTRLVEGKLQLPAGFSGCVVLGDGRVAPLVETDTLLNWIFEQQHRLNGSQPNRRNPEGKKPLAQPLAAPKTDVFATALNHSKDKRTVMIVDDSINVRRFLAITLEKAGYRIEQAKDGRDAIEKLQAQTHVDIIVSDVEMPRMDGFQFLAEVHNVETCKGVPVVMLTSRSGAKHRKLAKQLGAADYFSKPFKQNELLNRLAELIQSSSASAAAESSSLGAAAASSV